MTHDFIFSGVVIVALMSIVANVLLVWYIRGFTRRSSLIQDVTNDMLEALGNFSTHMESVYELPLFYGDETLKGLLAHSKDIVTDVKNYRDGFIFSSEGEKFDNEEGPPEEE